VEEDLSVTALGVCVADIGVGISDGLPDDVDKVCLLNLYMNHPAHLGKHTSYTATD
jgi:hypothetical protein